MTDKKPLQNKQKKTYKSSKQVEQARKVKKRKLVTLYTIRKEEHDIGNFLEEFPEKDVWLEQEINNDFYQGMDEKSIKQLNFEKETSLKVKEKELSLEYLKLTKYYKENGLDEFIPLSNKEKWVRNELEKWERDQPLFITGKYQDKEKINTIYQQAFIKFIKQLAPNVFQELKKLTKHFDELFREDKNKFDYLFDWERIRILFSIEPDLVFFINSSLDYSFLKIPSPYKNFEQGYKWGRHQLLFLVLYLFLIPVNDKKRDEIENYTLEILQNNLLYQFEHSNTPKDFDVSTLRNCIKKQSLLILEKLNPNSKSSLKPKSEKTIAKYIKAILCNDDKRIEPFLVLHIELMKWARRYKIEKDWMLHFAYFVLWQFSNNPQLKISDIEIDERNNNSLVPKLFEFKFNSWLVAEESRENYEERLRENFEYELEEYFQNVGRQLKLNKLKKATKPIDFDLVKPLVRKVVQNWSLEKIIENDFNINNTISEKKFFSSKMKHLKKELPKFAQFDLPI